MICTLVSNSAVSDDLKRRVEVPSKVCKQDVGEGYWLRQSPCGKESSYTTQA